jgi:hypothetical protein
MSYTKIIPLELRGLEAHLILNALALYEANTPINEENKTLLDGLYDYVKYSAELRGWRTDCACWEDEVTDES